MPLLDKEIDEQRLLSLLTLFRDQGAETLVLERQQVMQGQGLSSSGKTMEQYGFIRGLALALGYKVNAVSSQTWQAHYKGMIPSEYPEWVEQWSLKDTKKKSIYVCSVLFPELSLKKGPRSKKPSDGMSDSVLLGNYWLTKSGGSKVVPMKKVNPKSKRTNRKSA